VAFLATDLAKHARLEGDTCAPVVIAAAAGETATVPASSIASTATTSSMGGASTATFPFGGQVREGLNASVAHLQALLMSYQLRMQLGDGDGLNSFCYG
jgi:hypothetical protein